MTAWALLIKILQFNKNITWGELHEESWSSPKDSDIFSGTHLVEIENLELQSAETRQNETRFAQLLNSHGREIKNRGIRRRRIGSKQRETHAKCSNNEQKLHYSAAANDRTAPKLTDDEKKYSLGNRIESKEDEESASSFQKC